MKLDWLGGTNNDLKNRGARTMGKSSHVKISPLYQTQKLPKRLLLGSAFIVGAFVFSVITFQSLYASQTNQKPAEPVAVLQKASPVEMVDVIIPVRQIESGRLLEPSMFMRVRRPKFGLAEGVVGSLEELKGRYSKFIIAPNVPLRNEMTTRERPANQVASAIPEGSRAVTINVDAVTGVEGWAQAGAHVDISWISDILGEKAASTIVRNVRILSAERQVEAPAASRKGDLPVPTTVTLMALERDAQKISLASASGKLILLLRGPIEEDEPANSNVTPITYKDLVARNDVNDDRMVRGYVRTTDRSDMGEWVLLKDGRLMRRQ